VQFVGSGGHERCAVDERHRIVLDTNVFVAAVTSREGVSARLLLAARAGRFQLVVSPLLLDELSDVLARPKLRRYLSIEDARRFVDAVRALAVLVDDSPEEADPITEDPDDDFLVLLAEAAGADVLVSGDPDLTALQRPGLVVMTQELSGVARRSLTADIPGMAQ
jgi:putative PIN family toxin of toxin-antitoxin system